MFYWMLKMVFVGPVLKLLFRPWVEGLHHIPDEGAAILASNHLSFSDSIFLPLVLDRRVTFLAKADYFTGKGVKASPRPSSAASASCPSTAAAARPARPPCAPV